MFIAMNRFKISPEQGSAFEELWRNRESYLNEVPGFREFHLLRGPADESSVLYVSHTVWDSRDAFERWTESASFQKAHAQAKSPPGMYLGPPRFEGFEVAV